MRLDRATRTEIVVVLSRRNLLTLLAKLDGHPAHSACAIAQAGIDGPALLVTAEDNEMHYGPRAVPPGAVHPETEAWLTEHSPPW
jgi:hypothetical protein